MKPSTRRNLRILKEAHRNQAIQRDCPHPFHADGICTTCGNIVNRAAYEARWAKKERK